MSQKDLAVELKISEAALSRSLSGEAVLPENALEPFLDLTKAGADDREQARALMKTITSPAQPPSPPPPVFPPVSPPAAGLEGDPQTVAPSAAPPPSQARRPLSRKARGWTLVGIITALGLIYSLVQFILVPALSGPTPTPALTCSEPTPSLPTAWSATCTAKSVFNRTKGQFTLTDLGPDGKSVFLEVKFDDGEIIRRYTRSPTSTPERRSSSKPAWRTATPNAKRTGGWWSAAAGSSTPTVAPSYPNASQAPST
jgi:hypothetical protein